MALRGTNQEFGRPYNRRIVLETIRMAGPVSRAEIARRVGLTVQTVSTITRELSLLGFISGSRDAPKGRGQPPTTLSVEADGGFAVGLLVTPGVIRAGLMNLAGTLVESATHHLPEAPDAALALAADLVEAMRAAAPKGRVLGLGVATPGPSDVESMSFVGPTTLQGWQGVPIRERLAEATGLPTFLGADVAAAALAERLYGAGQKLGQFYYLYLGVGLGGSMVLDRAVLRGAHGNAGEIGHLPLRPDGEACPCGNRGCLERYLSLEALDRFLRAGGPPTGIGEAVEAEDPRIEAWVGDVAPLLRQAVAAIENLFDPETVVLGGLAPAALVTSLVAAAEPLPSSVAARRGRKVPRLILSHDGEAGVLRGAASLAMAGVLAPQSGLLFSELDPSLPITGDVAA